MAIAVIVESDRNPTPSLQNIVLTLHNIIFDLEFECSAQDTVSRMCEAWYLADYEKKEEVIPQTVLYLLMRSVGANGRMTDVRRVCAMRDSFQLLEIGGESFQSVQESLLRAAIHPHYIMHDDGRRFLAVMLSLHPQLTLAMHTAIKNQIPHCRSVTPPP